MKAHVSLNVADVTRSVAFYRSFFGVEPVKLKDDYAKFDLQSPALNLTMNQRPPAESGEHGRLGHLGVQVESHEQVDQARARLAEAGLIAVDEEDTVCCYARQDKVWATDPDGNEWEVFYVVEADVEAADFQADASGEPVEASADRGCCA